MVSLGEVVDALISQVGKGRAQADAETVKLAEIYKDDPLFSSFPVPRMALDEVVIDLKVAVSTGPSRGISFTRESREKVLDRIEKLVDDLPHRYRYVQNMPEDPAIWNPVRTKISEEVAEIIPAEVDVEPKSITVGTTAAVQRNIMQAIAHPKFKITRKGMGSFVEDDALRMEKYLRSEIEKIITEIVKSQPPPKERLDVLVSAADLREIPSDKITNVRLTLRESDLSWTKIETEDGIKEKLVPV